MSLSLTHEQKRKLQKLEEEIKLKREYEIKSLPRKEASSKATGIPIDIIDMDVIKIGTLLGLIKKKSVLEGKEPNTTNSLLDLFIGSDDTTKKIDHSNIPPHYRNTQQKVSESEKIQYHQQFVQQQCVYFSDITMNTIKTQLNLIKNYISINLEELTFSNFITIVKDNMDVIFEELLGENDDDLELWTILSILRNSLLGPLNICEYKKIIADQIIILRKHNKSHKNILNHLSLVEARLILYPGGLNILKGPISNNDFTKLLNELQFRTYTKNPKLEPFDVEDVIRNCCTPSLLNLPLDAVVNISLLGPYMNNSIGYLNNLLNTTLSAPAAGTDPWSFYVLSGINSDGSRLWVLDYKIKIFSNIFIKSVTQYLIKIHRTFYKDCFGTNDYIPNFYHQTTTTHFDVFLNMIKNILFISNHTLFVDFLKTVIIQKSCIIPTEYDFFNHLIYYDDKDYPVLETERPKPGGEQTAEGGRDLCVLRTPPSSAGSGASSQYATSLQFSNNYKINIESLFDTQIDSKTIKMFEQFISGSPSL